VDKDICERFGEAQEIAKEIFNKITKHGVGIGQATIAGLEITSLSLEQGKADRAVRIGCLTMFAHRILEGAFPSPREHVEDVCLICLKIREIIDIRKEE